MRDSRGKAVYDTALIGATVRDLSMSDRQEKTPILIGETGSMCDSNRIDFAQAFLTLGARGESRQLNNHAGFGLLRGMKAETTESHRIAQSLGL